MAALLGKPMVALVGALVLVSLVPAATVNANGIHSGAREVFAKDVGAYTVRVVTIPVVGDIHMDIYVAKAGTSDSVHDVVLQVSAEGPPQKLRMVGPIMARSSRAGENWYSVTMLIEEIGNWTFTITLNSPLGEEAVAFPLRMSRRGDINWGLVTIMVVFFLVVPLIALPIRRRIGRAMSSGVRPKRTGAHLKTFLIQH